jgi:hypothetical protein
LITSALNSAPGTTTGYTVTSDASPLGTGDFTAEAWINVSTTSPYQQSIFNSSRLNLGFDAGLSLYVGVGGTVGAFDNGISNSGVNFSTPTGTISTGTWYLVDFVRSGGNDTLYLDGSLVLDPGVFSQPDNVNLSGAFAVGANVNYTVPPATTSSTDNELNGNIDEFALYTQALSSDQIASHFAAGLEAPTVPEPSTWATMFLGLGVLCFAVRRREARS